MLFYIPVISQKRTEPKQTNKSINVTEKENWYNAWKKCGAMQKEN